MKKLAIGLAAAALAVVPAGIANATGGTGTTGNSVYINEYADFDFAGTNIDVGLQVRCTGLGAVEVLLEQGPPETGYPVATGTGLPVPVVCDGRTRAVGVTVVGVGFDVGKAKATAMLLTASGSKVLAQSSRQVYIRQV